MISEEEFKEIIASNIMRVNHGCFDVDCRNCCVNLLSCRRLPDSLRIETRCDVPNASLFQAYLDGKVVIVDREWCVVEED